MLMTNKLGNCLLLVLVVGLFLSGCSSSPKDLNQGKNAQLKITSRPQNLAEYKVKLAAESETKQKTIEDNVVLFQGIEPGKWTVKVWGKKQGYITRQGKKKITVSSGSVSTTTIDLEKRLIDLKVKVETPEQLNESEVKLVLENREKQVVLEGVSEFTFPELKPGKKKLIVKKKGTQLHEKTLDLTADKETYKISRDKLSTDIKYNLSVSVEGRGQVKKNPDKKYYQAGEQVTLKAVPAEGYMFQKWGGVISAEKREVKIKMDSNKQLGATFVKGNSKPDIKEIEDKNVDEGDIVEFDVQATDLDGDSLIYSANGDLAKYFNRSNQEFRWETSNEDDGSYQIEFVVSDGEDTDKETVNINVGDVNRKPKLEEIKDISVGEGESVRFEVNATDPDGDQITLRAEGDKTSNFNDGVFEWDTSAGDSGNYTVIIIADDGSKTDEETVNITVGDVNQPPKINNISDINVNEKEKVSLNPSVSDPDGDDVNLRVEGDLTQHYSGGEFNWNTDYDDAGSYSLTFVADDGKLETRKEINIDVDNVDRKPKLDDVGDITVTEKDMVSFNLSATDPDGDNISYESNDLPQSATLDQKTGQFEWSTDYNDAGEYYIYVKAEANGRVDGQNVRVKVNDKNRKPNVQLPSSVEVGAGEKISFSLDVSDPDGDNVYVSAEGDLIDKFNTATKEFNWDTTRGYDAGNYQITFEITDNKDTIIRTVDVIVNETDNPPTFNNLSDTGTSVGRSLEFDVNASDPDEDNVNIEMLEAPSEANFDGQTFTWTPQEGNQGTYDVKFRATSRQLSTTKTIQIMVDDKKYYINTSAEGGKATFSFNPDKQGYEEGEQVTVSVSPDSGFVFKEWGGDISGTSKDKTVTINGNMDIKAKMGIDPNEVQYVGRRWLDVEYSKFYDYGQDQRIKLDLGMVDSNDKVVITFVGERQGNGWGDGFDTTNGLNMTELDMTVYSAGEYAEYTTDTNVEASFTPPSGFKTVEERVDLNQFEVRTEISNGVSYSNHIETNHGLYEIGDTIYMYNRWDSNDSDSEFRVVNVSDKAVLVKPSSSISNFEDVKGAAEWLIEEWDEVVTDVLDASGEYSYDKYDWNNNGKIMIRLIPSDRMQGIAGTYGMGFYEGQKNSRDYIDLNTKWAGGTFGLRTVAHEFQHLMREVEAYYSGNEGKMGTSYWINEGQSEITETIVCSERVDGVYTGHGSLMAWVSDLPEIDGNTTANGNYGSAALFAGYIYAKYPDVYKEMNTYNLPIYKEIVERTNFNSYRELLATVSTVGALRQDAGDSTVNGKYSLPSNELGVQINGGIPNHVNMDNRYKYNYAEELDGLEDENDYRTAISDQSIYSFKINGRGYPVTLDVTLPKGVSMKIIKFEDVGDGDKERYQRSWFQ